MYKAIHIFVSYYCHSTINNSHFRLFLLYTRNDPNPCRSSRGISEASLFVSYCHSYAPTTGFEGVYVSVCMCMCSHMECPNWEDEEERRHPWFKRQRYPLLFILVRFFHAFQLSFYPFPFLCFALIVIHDSRIWTTTTTRCQPILYVFVE